MDCAANWLGLLTQMLTEIFKVKRKNLKKFFSEDWPYILEYGKLEEKKNL